MKVSNSRYHPIRSPREIPTTIAAANAIPAKADRGRKTESRAGGHPGGSRQARETPPEGHAGEASQAMKKINRSEMGKVIFLFLIEFCSFIYAQEFPVLKGDYLGQTPPGDTPVVFARGIVSTDYQEHGSPSFSPDGNEVFWKSNRRPGPDNKEWLTFIMTMKRENGRWSAPYVSSQKRFPVFSADGRRAYFSSVRPHSDTAQVSKPDLDIWFVERHGDDWG